MEVIREEEVLSIFRKTGALLDGHFLLSSGLHSGQYFQCARVLQYPDFAAMLCGGISEHFKSERIHSVIAPALGGIVVGQEVGRQLNVRTMFTERKDGTMQLRRGFQISRDERVLVCEDVVTTGGSVQEVIQIVRAHGAEIAGVGFIVDRSGGNVRFEIAGKQYALLRLEVLSYAKESCPLCVRNIPLVKPGSREENPGRGAEGHENLSFVR